MIKQVLYRAWRPRDFEELAGQDHIRRTLENEILLDRISHAYLFTGPRGTGKTTTARILAKALNCSHRQGAHPCGECESCRAITNGNSMDVLEIDGASNRGIDEIRELKEKIGFLPALGKYKVYIVDEVHMLTAEAFNALLKTLEEPPSHVIFVLATTDPQKMPSTVLSRCQRFDFRKISHSVIMSRLEEILSSEERKAEPEALSMIARQADGSLRDAISLLDQCLSFTQDTLSLDDASAILGLVRQEALASLLAAVMDREAAALFAQLGTLFTQGVDPVELLKEFAGYCRDLLLLALCGERTELVAASGGQRRLMAEQGDKLGPLKLQQILNQADQAAAGGRYRGNSRYMAEALFAGLLLDAGGQQERVGLSAYDAGAASASAPAASTPTASAVAASASAVPTTAPPAPAASATPAAVPSAPAASAAPTPAASASPTTSAVSAPASTPPAPAPAASATPAAVPSASAASAAFSSASDPPAPAPPTSATAFASSVQAGELSTSQWDQILQIIKSQKVILHAIMIAAMRQELKEGTLYIYFDREKGRFHKERCEEEENFKMITEAAAQSLGSPVAVVCGFLSEGPDIDPVQKAIDLFGRDIVKIE
ncbi:MAG: DNA polymerase III subunit gamma/tau [Peptococcaceae bacterium]|jgi:DNA polymerase-3 subunit gamma/tau|nr:DNA polymerase III subunit gamma/tau [Peptococcaceae bacterium]